MVSEAGDGDPLGGRWAGELPDGPVRCRPAWAEIDLGAIEHNATILAALVAPARLCAVVKAGGYGHGAAEAARAALAGGASHLAVALVEEGWELRRAGIAAPVLVLSEPPPEAMADLVAAGLTPTIYTGEGLQALRAAAGTQRPGVHVKVDTGMHRVGAEPGTAVSLAAKIASDPALRLSGFWTHLAVSDELDDPFTELQLDRFDEAVEQLRSTGVDPGVTHAANSGGTLWHRRSHYGMVRCGIALYGLAPTPDVDTGVELRPALSLRAQVSYVKEVGAGERISYGLRYEAPADTVVATVPLGYADGVPRGLAAAGLSVLVGGRRRPLAGTVTMDQLMVDCGPGAQVRRGDEVVLIGEQGAERIGAWEWAAASSTIAYEIVCGVSGRVPRMYLPSAAARPDAGQPYAGQPYAGHPEAERPEKADGPAASSVGRHP